MRVATSFRRARRHGNVVRPDMDYKCNGVRARFVRERRVEVYIEGYN